MFFDSPVWPVRNRIFFSIEKKEIPGLVGPFDASPDCKTGLLPSVRVLLKGRDQ